MRKTFKYRAYLNKATQVRAVETLTLCRTLYNSCLEQRKMHYEQFKHYTSCTDQKNQLVELKKVFPEYKNAIAQTLQDVVERVDKSFQNFFRRVKQRKEKAGYPRFKNRDRYDSFTLKQAGWKLEGKYLILSRIGRFKLKLHRPIEGRIKTITIKRSASNKWHVCFSCDNVELKPLLKTSKVIGIDVGCESFLTDNEGNKVANNRFLNKSTAVLEKRQQVFAKKKKGSNNRKRAKVLVAKIYEKIYNQRKDFHYKTAKKLVRENDIICIEDMKSWNSFRGLNKSMRDVAWFNFFNILSFKAVEAGKKIVKVNPRNTSQMCSRCGAMVKKDLSVRIHKCSLCSLEIDRDINAAINILRLGMSLLKDKSLLMKPKCLSVW